MNTIYTPTILADMLRKALESRFPFVWARGEISNFARAASGHIYFSLKDAHAQIQCVWFVGRQPQDGQKFDPLTGEIYEEPRPSAASMLANGMDVLCAGAINIYAARSQYQLNVELVQPAGAGLLALEFEARKTRLASAGYFKMDRKRPLPSNIARVAVIASPAGAAIHDFLSLVAERGLSGAIRLYPAPAQGSDAANLMAEAIRCINSQGWAQVIVLIRGGGSLEDLWAFNEEILAEAVFSSSLPVVAGIGHEIDYTLADMTADVRAATPSHAAQLLWPLRSDLCQSHDQLDMALERAMGALLEKSIRNFDHFNVALNWLSPLEKLKRLEIRLQNANDHLYAACERLVERKTSRLERSDGAFAASRSFSNMIGTAMLKVDWAWSNLQNNIEARLGRLSASLEALDAGFVQLDPGAPLKRGYALLFNSGQIIHSINQVKMGEKINAVIHDGLLDLTLNGKTPHFLQKGDAIFDAVGKL